MKFIPDEEINLYEKDLLGTKPYVETLSEIIKNAHTPFTIGLFGGWGVGKSSIIKTIQDKFNKDKNSEIEVFKYDAWKYANDSFRRTFIYELKNHFKLPTTENFDSFYKEKHEEIKTKIGISPHWWIYLLVFVLSIFVINIVPKIEGKEFEWTTFVISVFISGIITFISKTLVQYKISITTPKLFAPEQFEEVFNEIIDRVMIKERSLWKWIKEILNKDKKITKLVIVIDNIDRCHKELAFELLLTVKNFLEKEGVVFVIPVDDEAIRKYLNEQGYDANEFLRKLFHTTIKIKKISEGDLFDFAKQLNEKNGLNLPIEVISIIAHQFSRNPRKIIQFLNILQTELKLAEEQEKKEAIPPGTITQNLPFYTKLLIIREEWPELYLLYQKNPHLLEKDVRLLVERDGIKIEQLTSEQVNFLRRTKHIIPNTKNYELFFNNKDEFKGIPDKTNNYVESNDLESIKRQLKNEELDINALIEFIDKKFEIAYQRGEIKTTIVNIVSLIFEMSLDDDLKEKIVSFLYSNGKILGGLRNFINSNELKEIIDYIESDTLLTFTKEYDDISKNIFSLIVSKINQKDNQDIEFILKYVTHFKDSPDKLKQIADKFSNLLKKHPEFINKVKGLLKEKTVIENLIRPELIDDFIEKIQNNQDDEDSKERLAIISNYNSKIGLTNEQAKKLITKLLSFINTVNDFEKLPFWLSHLHFYIGKIEEPSIHSNIFNSLRSKFSWLWQSYSSNKGRKEYQDTLKIFLRNVAELYSVISDTNQESQLISWMNQFFAKDDSPGLVKFINTLYYDIVNKFEAYQWPFSQNIINRFNQISDWTTKKEIAKTLNLMLKKTTKEKGLTENQVKTIFKYYFSLFDNEEYYSDSKKWLPDLLKNNPILNEYFNKAVSELPENRKFNIVGALQHIGKKDLIKEIIAAEIQKSDCNNLENVMNKLISQKIDKRIIKKVIESVLVDLDGSNGKFNCFIEYILENNLANKQIYETIAEKIKPLLSSNNKEKILFALKIILEIKKISNTKLEALKVLVNDLNPENLNFDEHEKELLEKAKSKLQEKNHA